MRIASKKLYFIISDDDVGPKKPFVWCELPADFYFQEYNVAGVNSEHDEIYLSLSTSNIKLVYYVYLYLHYYYYFSYVIQFVINTETPHLHNKDQINE